MVSLLLCIRAVSIWKHSQPVLQWADMTFGPALHWEDQCIIIYLSSADSGQGMDQISAMASKGSPHGSHVRCITDPWWAFDKVVTIPLKGAQKIT